MEHQFSEDKCKTEKDKHDICKHIRDLKFWRHVRIEFYHFIWIKFDEKSHLSVNFGACDNHSYNSLALMIASVSKTIGVFR